MALYGARDAQPQEQLFVGNARGGELVASLSSFAATCTRHGVNPQKFLAQALVKVPHVAGGYLDR